MSTGIYSTKAIARPWPCWQTWPPRRRERTWCPKAVPCRSAFACCRAPRSESCPLKSRKGREWPPTKREHFKRKGLDKSSKHPFFRRFLVVSGWVMVRDKRDSPKHPLKGGKLTQDWKINQRWVFSAILGYQHPYLSSSSTAFWQHVCLGVPTHFFFRDGALG